MPSSLPLASIPVCGSPRVPASQAKNPRAVVGALFGCLFTPSDIRAAGAAPEETSIPSMTPAGMAYLKSSRAQTSHRLLDRLRDRPMLLNAAPVLLGRPRPAASFSPVSPGASIKTRARALPAGFVRLPLADLWSVLRRNRVDQSCPDLNQWMCDYRLVVPVRALVELADEGPIAARRWGKLWRNHYVAQSQKPAPVYERNGFPRWMAAVHLAAAWMWCVDLDAVETLAALRRTVHPQLWGVAAAYLLFVINRSSLRAHPELSYSIPEAMIAALRANPLLSDTPLFREGFHGLALWFVVQVSRMHTWNLGRRAASAFLDLETTIEQNTLSLHPREDSLRVILLSRASSRSVTSWVQACAGKNIWNAPLEAATGWVGHLRGQNLRFLSGLGAAPEASDWIRMQVRCLSHPILARDWLTWSAVLRGDEPSTNLNSTRWGSPVDTKFPGVFWTVPSGERSVGGSLTEYIQVPATCLIDALVAGARLGWGTRLSLWDTAARPAIRRALSDTSISGACVSSNFWWWIKDHRRVWSDFLKQTKDVVPWETQRWLLPGVTTKKLLDMGTVGHLALKVWPLSRADLWILRRWWTMPNHAGSTMLEQLKPDQRAWAERLLLRASGSYTANPGAFRVTNAVLHVPDHPRPHRQM